MRRLTLDLGRHRCHGARAKGQASSRGKMRISSVTFLGRVSVEAWPQSCSTSSRAFGNAATRALADSTGAILSASPCRTSVGYLIRSTSGVTSVVEPTILSAVAALASALVWIFRPQRLMCSASDSGMHNWTSVSTIACLPSTQRASLEESGHCPTQRLASTCHQR